MKVRKKEIFDADQWFPGKIVPGVQGTDKKKWCGCVISGYKEFDKPHIHPVIGECVLVSAGDWIITDLKGNRCLVKPNLFDQIYEKVLGV